MEVDGTGNEMDGDAESDGAGHAKSVANFACSGHSSAKALDGYPGTQ